MRSCFQQPSTDFSAPVDLLERRALGALYTVCSLVSGIENAVSNLSNNMFELCVLLCGDLEDVRHKLISMEQRCILNNLSNLYIVDHWALHITLKLHLD